MKKRITLIFLLLLSLGLTGCKSGDNVPNKQEVNQDQGTDMNLSVDSFIPDINKEYTFKSSTTDREKEIKVIFELIEDGKYKRVESSENEYELEETYKVENDSISLIESNAKNYGSENVNESVYKDKRIVLKSVAVGDVWENKYTARYEVNDINYYKVDEKLTFTGYEKIIVMGKEMNAAVIVSNETRTREGDLSIEKANRKFWIVKELGAVKYEIEKIYGEDKFNASFELISTSEKK